jgi:hypothetical protein
LRVVLELEGEVESEKRLLVIREVKTMHYMAYDLVFFILDAGVEM